MGVTVVTVGLGVRVVTVGAAVTLRVWVPVTCGGGVLPGELHAATARPSAAALASMVMARFIAPPRTLAATRASAASGALHT
jgi:hypothetical protein